MSAFPAATATPSPGNTPHRIRRLSASAAGFPTRSLDPPSLSNDAPKTKLKIQIPHSHSGSDTDGDQSNPSPTPLPGPESAPVHPFAHSTSKLELLPHSTAGSGGIDIEEEARLFDELCRTSKQHLPPVPQYRRFSPPPPSVVSSDIFLADNTGESPRSFAQDVRITGWTSVGDAPPSSGVKKSLQAVADGSGSAFIVYDCVITTKEGTTIHILKRYTSFVELDTALRRTLPRHLLPSIPILPPKNPLARFRPAFLDHRRRLLQYWLANVLLHPEVGGSEVVKKWDNGSPAISVDHNGTPRERLSEGNLVG